ncbi:citrate synthase [Streptomyces beihaiensis]|uniref:citrate synthase (unknown stereospecificity) n=1 Tax=Streptomyces beihaiensis TaxID=2984495 RepID=A0ABT3TVQ5_9ACTN|nr:citrate synthase [Streptomyces beihaiensis]MCX3060571.1 citrate synthase [Streptomyces beihaiensis]
MRDQGPLPARQARRLTTRETAERLGVKPETVYAYVSRGQLTSRRDPGRRGSTFDAAEVEALARRTNRETTARPGSAELSVRTRLTLIDGDRYFFRGVDAVQLAAHHSYEEVAEWLWTGTLRPGATFTAPRESLEAARQAVAALPELSGPVDRLRVAAIAAAVADPLRYDLSEESVLGAARTLIPTLAATLPLCRSTYADGPPIARRLWGRLSHQDPDEASLRVLDMALGLLADHDLAASTLAVRVAASARAHAYAAVSAGLGALEGPLHGAASGLAHRMLLDVLDRKNAAPVIAAELRDGRRIPGLGHRLYEGEDPRAQALFDALEELPSAHCALAAARDVVTTTARHTDLRANVDLALAVLTASSGMAPEAGETIFAVARTAGWVAHALEEYGEQPLRMRPSGQYVGLRPPQPLPTTAPGEASSPDDE